MKDAIITVRVPAATRKRIAAMARSEGRSLSQQIERLIEGAMEHRASLGPHRRGVRILSGALRSARVPSAADFRSVRSLIAESLGRGKLD